MKHVGPPTGRRSLEPWGYPYWDGLWGLGSGAPQGELVLFLPSEAHRSQSPDPEPQAPGEGPEPMYFLKLPGASGTAELKLRETHGSPRS